MPVTTSPQQSNHHSSTYPTFGAYLAQLQVGPDYCQQLAYCKQHSSHKPIKFEIAFGLLKLYFYTSGYRSTLFFHDELGAQKGPYWYAKLKYTTENCQGLKSGTTCFEIRLFGSSVPSAASTCEILYINKPHVTSEVLNGSIELVSGTQIANFAINLCKKFRRQPWLHDAARVDGYYPIMVTKEKIKLRKVALPLRLYRSLTSASKKSWYEKLGFNAPQFFQLLIKPNSQCQYNLSQAAFERHRLIHYLRTLRLKNYLVTVGSKEILDAVREIFAYYKARLPIDNTVKLGSFFQQICEYQATAKQKPAAFSCGKLYDLLFVKAFPWAKHHAVVKKWTLPSFDLANAKAYFDKAIAPTNSLADIDGWIFLFRIVHRIGQSIVHKFGQDNSAIFNRVRDPIDPLDLPIFTEFQPLNASEMCKYAYHDQLVSMLLLPVAQINNQLCDGSTPLYLAVQMGHYNVVQYLISQQVKITPRYNGATALHVAAYLHDMYDTYHKYAVTHFPDSPSCHDLYQRMQVYASIFDALMAYVRHYPYASSDLSSRYQSLHYREMKYHKSWFLLAPEGESTADKPYEVLLSSVLFNTLDDQRGAYLNFGVGHGDPAAMILQGITWMKHRYFNCAEQTFQRLHNLKIPTAVQYLYLAKLAQHKRINKSEPCVDEQAFLNTAAFLGHPEAFGRLLALCKEDSQGITKSRVLAFQGVIMKHHKATMQYVKCLIDNNERQKDIPRAKRVLTAYLARQQQGTPEHQEAKHCLDKLKI